MNDEQLRIVDKIATVFSVGSGKPTLVALCEELVVASTASRDAVIEECERVADKIKQEWSYDADLYAAAGNLARANTSIAYKNGAEECLSEIRKLKTSTYSSDNVERLPAATVPHRQELADQVGYYFAALISGNNQPHMSGDPRARLHGERRRRFDETCLEVVDTIAAAIRSADPAQPSWRPIETADRGAA